MQGANASLMGIASLIGPAIFTQSFAVFIGAGAIVYLPGMPFLLVGAHARGGDRGRGLHDA